MTPTVLFLDELKSAAEAAKTAEMNFRREAAARIAALEEERAFAFRRFNIMEAITKATAPAESEEIAVANAHATLRMRLGWSADTEAQAQVLTHFSPVAIALFRAVAPGEEGVAADVGEALETFERWYSEARGRPFWTLFDNPMPDTPRVDF